ncbi:imidazole glycerol phosphate synthase subunit HisH [Weizmannia acidilactici]|uniref:Imidazole glycerol phosphate synthase subunit HisH n=1 Tax=Weizmannia acidilactici TaxID=2607726 RepID=A0A5J4JJL7_9BACI|nr:imidazole glycerol phosphate synthase subunit HisH [Weizmannia acidilactici]GER68082.1 imidazole glycerol phosphate synthase subunit HisH [Weizmannia acidilactici]GER70925.1 imidazole glycerol phosphate synthase subunit HisH [Weizmannia acidilactici]GER73960.1 imidazole glycerol phosphate synthase subunit HisH [Weizmannia acidilactici]
MIAIVDYGMGNIASASNAFRTLGYDVVVTDDPEQLNDASHIILPGVGAFKAAIEEIEKRGLRPVLQDLARKKPFLGICLGMQLLFETGFENGVSKGLGFIPGTVELIQTGEILPHIGWNTLDVKAGFPSFKPFQNKHVYFVHSYQAKTSAPYIVATTDYGAEIPAVVRNRNVYGMQFHPEKSGKVGMALLKTFLQESSLEVQA